MNEATKHFTDFFNREREALVYDIPENIIKIITNDFLRSFDLEDSELFKDIYESPDMKNIHQQQMDDILNANLKKLLVKRHEEPPTNHKPNSLEDKVFSKLSFLKYFYTKDVRKKMQQQLNECEKVLESDMCMRNLKLKKEIKIETDKLKTALKYDLVTVATNTLYDLYSYLYPNETNTDLYVRISNAMNQLGIYNRKSFPTLDATFKRLRDDEQAYLYDAKRILYLRVKKHIIKNRKKLLIK